MLRFLILTFACFALLETTQAKHYKVASHLASPFLETDADHPKGYKGYVVDLLDEMAKKLIFTYEFVFPTDKFYGRFDPETKKWNGMMGVLLNGDADMIVADFTETEERAQAADFTSPFMVTGLGIMYHQTSRQALPFNNIEELGSQMGVQYGVVAGGSTHQFFKNSQNDTFIRIARYFEEHPEVLVSSATEGVDRVMSNEGKYAFITEGIVYHYLKKTKYPALILVGDTFYPRQFGVVFPKGSADKDAINQVIVEMKEHGDLDALATKWNLK